MTVEQAIEVAVGRFTLRPGEIVVLTCPGRITRQQAEDIRAWWNDRFPDNHCIVMSDGGQVSGVLEVAS